MNGIELRKMDKLVFTVCTRCRDHEKSGFVEGVKVGIRLETELKKSYRGGTTGIVVPLFSTYHDTRDILYYLSIFVHISCPISQNKSWIFSVFPPGVICYYIHLIL